MDKRPIASFIAVSTLIVLLSCGKDPVNQPSPATSKKYQVYLFSAPWCEPCRKELKELGPLWANQDENIRKNISLKLFVQEGEVQGTKPTPESTLQFQESLGLTLETVADDWRWKTYRGLIKNSWNLPAAVVIDEGGNKVKAFVAPPKFTPQELVDYLNELLKSPA